MISTEKWGLVCSDLCGEVRGTSIEPVPSPYCAGGCLWWADAMAGMAVADYFPLMPPIWDTHHFEKQKCSFVVGIEEVAEGEELETVG